MDVKIELKCGRCGKVAEVTVPLEEAQELEANEEVRKQHHDGLRELLNNTLKTEHPDVIVAVRTEGAYAVHSMNNLCNVPDAKRNKGCGTRVMSLIDDMFMLTPPAPKKKKVPKAPKKDSDIPKDAKNVEKS